ncbi:MAG: multidrug transporter [Candidatus Marinimicrobia bacterium CG08_land_8_20_14_0_20_45_22]|nr:MAG: multidrug transporter [Candidatus Marinimicrobia bacterium CG08_land_8_20_14_0_20_45_22]
MENGENEQLAEKLQTLSGTLINDGSPVAAILAAGHGKRIKSDRSKMLHEIWGVPTVLRVANAASIGLETQNQVIVVGIKAREVAEKTGKATNRLFVYQKEQKGTGDAVRVALSGLSSYQNLHDIYILPGDMGLITPEVIHQLKTEFEKSKHGMMILTGNFSGDTLENTYGRILRVPEFDAEEKPSGVDRGKVIEIKEHKDILALPDGKDYKITYNKRLYCFQKSELLKIREYNAGVYAVNYQNLSNFISCLTPDNVQGELYLTDIISIFNHNGISVGAYTVTDNSAVIGFNVKSVLREMGNIARRKVWKQLRDIIFIEDEDDFFIADEVVRQILELDLKQPPLDIEIGKGVYLGKNVQLSHGVSIRSGSTLNGNIVIGKGTLIHERVSLSTYANQVMVIGKNCIIMRGDMLKGNIRIGDNTSIESSVIVTGSDEFPTVIGNNVTIKGTTYIFGSVIEDDLFIEHSVIKCKKVERTVRKDGTIQSVRWVMPPPQGLDIISSV